MQPIASAGLLSKIGFHVAPPSVVLKIPPVVLP